MYFLKNVGLYQPLIIFKLSLHRQPGNLLISLTLPSQCPRCFHLYTKHDAFLVLPSSGHFLIQQVDQNKELRERQQNLLQKRTCQDESTGEMNHIYICYTTKSRLMSGITKLLSQMEWTNCNKRLIKNIFIAYCKLSENPKRADHNFSVAVIPHC